jgi:hypothetical protein
VVEDALLSFEEKLPSHDMACLVVTPQMIIDPSAMLADMLSDTPAIDWTARHQAARKKEIEYITGHIEQNAGSLSATHGLTLSQTRCEMAARYFFNHVLEIDDAVRRIKIYHDTVKEIELEISKSANLNIIFEQDAVDFLMTRFIDHGISSEDILSKLYHEYYDGLNLIREKTGNNRFFLTKADLLDSEAYLNDLIRKEIK